MNHRYRSELKNGSVYAAIEINRSVGGGEVWSEGVERWKPGDVADQNWYLGTPAGFYPTTRIGFTGLSS
ncbi:hypothetical protein Ahy_B03g062032 isoform B [Arachis hypogaea]|uniref:Uncharacterized protein n=1 Tax=Arachis hypogaea TaxID=3818 RepID=A0A444ZSU0_ARAHY|nr:hypothetical protein Ahy_B03g062032 isoform B [Arachis hypogaea]